jgi:hypothetical protein
MVAHTNQTPASAIPNSEREVAQQMLHAQFTPGMIGVQD